MISKKKNKDLQPWEEALMEAQDRSCDWKDEKYLEPILKLVLKINN